MNKPFITALTILLFSIIAANAQKLPAVQLTGLRAPDNIKIDGKPTELTHFQAYNKLLHIFYTIANDDNNIYFILQATDAHDIEKVLSGGVTFSAKSTDKKTTDIPLAITFPRMYYKNTSAIMAKVRNENVNIDVELPGINKDLTDNSNLIQIAGIKTITDTIISVYNEQGIKAIGLFDNKKAYTYELAIPLKYLKQIIDNQTSFIYNIKLNGTFNALKPVRPPGYVPKTTLVKVNSFAEMSAQQDLMAPVDFSGTYTLAKK